ncbi:MAG TPA: sulfatase, partial [Opitutae bacterium]|nr:sulfatase [Opitutae bacterium]
AATGMKFTNGYAACPVCSPTRASIMTGRHPVRVDITDWIPGQSNNNRNKLLHPDDRNNLAHEEVTIAEELKSHGYQTFFAGKWHLGPTEEFWPTKQGYDVNAGGFSKGGPYGGKKYFSPYGNPRLDDGPDGEHLPDRLATETCAFIDKNKGKPFFAMLSFYSVHTPLIGRPDLVAKYKKKATEVSGAEFGDEEMTWPKNGKTRKVRILQKHAVYGAMVEAMDLAVGKVLKKLEELGLEDEVVVAFTSDNGGLSTSEGSPTSNLPLRGGKGWLYEGGIREPFLVRWPGKTEPGSVCSHPVMSTDFFSTFVKAAGGKVEGAGPIDGVDLMPLLEGGKTLQREALYWHYPHYSNQGGFPGAAIRVGNWKMIERFEDGRVHLYDLANDPGERSDLSKVHPERTSDMRDKLHKWYREVDAKFLRAKGEEGRQPWRP